MKVLGDSEFARLCVSFSDYAANTGFYRIKVGNPNEEECLDYIRDHLLRGRWSSFPLTGIYKFENELDAIEFKLRFG